MARPGGTKTSRRSAALIPGLLLAAGLPACAIDAGTGPEPTADSQSHRPAPATPAEDAGVRGVEARNYGELHQRLAQAAGSVLLTDAGPADGPSAGFNKVATVISDGPHTVTAACVGTRQTRIHLSRNTTEGTEHVVFEVDCTGTRTQIVHLRKGYVSAQLTRQDPTGAWTGAVAGIVITVE